MAGKQKHKNNNGFFIRNLISPVDDLISDLEEWNQLTLNKYTICVYYFVQNFSTNLSNLCNHLHKENPPVKWGIILQLLTVNISVGPPGFEPGTYAL